MAAVVACRCGARHSGGRGGSSGLVKGLRGADKLASHHYITHYQGTEGGRDAGIEAREGGKDGETGRCRALG